jgi:hypothetical protein
VAQRQREVSESSSSSDFPSDPDDLTFTKSADEPPPGKTLPQHWGGRKKKVGSRSRDPNFYKTDKERIREGGNVPNEQGRKKSKKPRLDGLASGSSCSHTLKTTGKAKRVGPTDSEDEASPPYFRPHIKTLSVKAINDRLDRTFNRDGMKWRAIDYLAAWWPKTIVAKHHEFQAKHQYLLTLGVKEWWSRLLIQIHTSGLEWPDELERAEKAWLISRIKEITFQKEGAAVRGERDMMEAGDIVSADGEIGLDD